MSIVMWRLGKYDSSCKHNIREADDDNQLRNMHTDSSSYSRGSTAAATLELGVGVIVEVDVGVEIIIVV